MDPAGEAAGKGDAVDAAEREHGAGGHDQAVGRPRRTRGDAGGVRRHPSSRAAVPKQLHHLHFLVHPPHQALSNAGAWFLGRVDPVAWSKF